MQVIAIDIGYGDTKVITENRQFKFPTAIEWEQESFADFEESSLDTYEFKGKRYVVGQKAVDRAITTRGFNFLVKYTPLLAYHSIKEAKLNLDEPIKLITGISIQNWSDRDEFRKSLETIVVDDKVIKPEVVIVAQGRGVYEDFTEDKNGIVCVVDIGYNTLDFLVFNDGVAKPNLSFATKQGANIVITQLQAKMSKKFGADISEQIAKQIFNDGYFVNFGSKVDMSDEIEDSKRYYIEFIAEEIKSRQEEILRKALKVIFSGGGAYFCENIELPKNAVFSKKPYEFANVRGYYAIGKE